MSIPTTITSVVPSAACLGGHWMSDVLGALVLGALYLLGVEWRLGWHLRRRPCAGLEVGFNAIETGRQDRPESLLRDGPDRPPGRRLAEVCEASIA